MLKKKISKIIVTKISKAVGTLKSFSSATVSGNDIILNDFYAVNDEDSPVTFTFSFNNIGLAVTTDILLDNVVVKEKITESIRDFAIGSDKTVANKFLKLFSSAAATSITSVPAELKVDLVISGGVATKSYPLSSFTLNEAGDTVNIDISIFFLHV